MQALANPTNSTRLTAQRSKTMSDSPENPSGTEDGEESFAALLDQYSPGSGAELRVGDKIEGKIISIGSDTVFVDTGTKIDASR